MSEPRISRIARRFEALRGEGRAGLATFITAGDPDPETSMEILSGLVAAGADIIELGMPFSDPMADGPAIQAAGARALGAGASLKATLEMVRSFRAGDGDTPIILMGYFNPIYVHGPEKFIEDAEAAGVDGLIIVDLPPEETEMRAPIAASGLDLILLIAPTTDDARAARILGTASGFVYYVSITGITGTASPAAADIEAAVTRLRRHTSLPIAVGFGIKTPAQAAEVAALADCVVVGSALVGQIAEHLDGDGKPLPGCAAAVLGLVGELAAGVRGARGNSAA